MLICAVLEGKKIVRRRFSTTNNFLTEAQADHILINLKLSFV